MSGIAGVGLMSIRPYENADYHAVTKLLKEAGLFYLPMDSRKSLRAMISKDPNAILVGVMEDEVIATCYITGAGNFVFLWRFAVDKEVRHLNIGTKFLAQIEEFLKREGCEYVSLFSRGKVSKFWEKNGYEFGHAYHYMGKKLKKR